MAQMAKGGIVMDVVNAEQARIAEEAGVREYKTNVAINYLNYAKRSYNTF